MKTIKQLLFAAGVLLVPVCSYAANPVRYVQISTNSFSVQAGSANVQGITTSSITARVGTIPTLTISTVSVNTNQAYMILYSSTSYDVPGSSATVSGAFVPTKTSITLTPKSTSSRIEITVTGSLLSSNGAGTSAVATVFRNSTNIGGASGMCTVGGGAASAYRSPCTMSLIDIPATTSPVTYTVYMLSTSGSTSITWSTTGETTTMTVKEWAY